MRDLWRNFLICYAALWIVVLASQAFRDGKAVQSVETWPAETVDGSEAYYPARDTSFLRYLCCGVGR